MEDMQLIHRGEEGSAGGGGEGSTEMQTTEEFRRKLEREEMVCALNRGFIV